MAEVLVLVDHVEGEIKKATYELLTAARALGEPSAVVVGPGSPAKSRRLAAHGAEKVYVAETDRGRLPTPQVDVLAALMEAKSPAAVLIAVSADGKEIAGRMALRTGSAWLNDVVDVSADGRDAFRVRRGVGRAGQGRHRPPGDHRAAGVVRGRGRRRRGGRRDRRGARRVRPGRTVTSREPIVGVTVRS